MLRAGQMMIGTESSRRVTSTSFSMGEGVTIQYANVFMAACVLATIPAVILFIFLQRDMIKSFPPERSRGILLND
jgi:ABC-type glycerol-3-phosphate transport system permease component